MLFSALLMTVALSSQSFANGGGEPESHPLYRCIDFIERRHEIKIYEVFDGIDWAISGEVTYDARPVVTEDLEKAQLRHCRGRSDSGDWAEGVLECGVGGGTDPAGLLASYDTFRLTQRSRRWSRYPAARGYLTGPNSRVELLCLRVNKF